METRQTRSLGPARIVALVLVALAVGALAYLRFAPDTDPVSVPSGAHAGELILKPCTYGTERGGYRADCGTLVVPENRGNPKSRLIALPVKRIRARSAHPGTPVFRLEGGPGITNMDFSKASRFAGTHDVVLVGYRGVDGSSRLDCPEVVSVLKHSADMLGARRSAPRPTPTGPARLVSARMASTSPATRCRSASRTSKPPGVRSGIAAST